MNRSFLRRASVLLLALLAPGPAAANIDAPLPNVLLLVDSSGSMEYKTATPGQFPQCNPGGGVNERNRWIGLLEVLTGTIQDYRCEAVDRRSGAFATEFALPGGIPPIDYLYRNPYHRPLSGSCTYGPNNAALNPSDAYRWTEPFLHEYTSPSLACGGTFQQSADGLIDVYGSFIRFGLMTLDNLPGPETGVSGTSAEYAAGVEGGFSYYWNNYAQGMPDDCDEPIPYEVGARNPAAPPWEGRLVPFGKAHPTLAEHNQRNEHVEKVLLATRPYGASPLAGMLHDAYDFLLRDNTNDENRYIGPQGDELVTGGCRDQVVILLTDGEPNLDLRPHCEGNGACPFDRTHEIAGRLRAAGIQVFVVGFAATETHGGLDCKQMSDSDIFTAEGACGAGPGDRNLQVCCSLHRIAFEGGTERAYFAEDQAALRAELDKILREVAGGATSRTRPATAPANGIPDHLMARAYRFLSAFESNPGGLPAGRLVRQRYECGQGDAYPSPPGSSEQPDGEEDEVQGIEPERGDDFVENLQSSAGDPRRFFTVLPLEGGISARTIRPLLATNNDPDGLGEQRGELASGTAEEFVQQVANHATAFPAQTQASSCAPTNGGAALDRSECAERILRWTLGLDDGTAAEPRCPSPGSDDCSLFGAIFRSTPRIVDFPNALTQDESYEGFANRWLARPMMLYTATNDGFLHAFKVHPNNRMQVPSNGNDGNDGNGGNEGGTTQDDTPVNERRNNELWAFVPPAVIPNLQAQYPGVYQRLLDGEPIVKDVVATEESAMPGGFRFERTLGAAQSAGSTFRTVLVQSFGEGWPGYFALDITDPATGPRFLWQLTTAANGEPLFGTGGTPLIATVFLRQDTDTTGREVAVAVLPGGKGGAPTGSACPREPVAEVDHIPHFRPRDQLPCYPASGAAAHSITIVRLDSGEVLRTFRFKHSIPESLAASSMPEAANSFEGRTGDLQPLASPVTGRPVAFPSDVGAVADRIFLGDQDGVLWRIDVSAPNPRDWDLKLFFDAYAADTSSDAPFKGQPIETPPILSVDDIGRITVNFSTGDQEALTASGTENYVWSLTEARGVENPEDMQVLANWYLHFEDGKRVTGPMVLFSSTLYFTTYTPSANACGDETGTSHIYSVDYVHRKQGSGDGPAGGPEEGPRFIPLVPGQEEEDAPMEQQGLVTGLALMHLPSCFEDPADQAYNAFFPGYTQRARPGGMAPGLFQLHFHTGQTPAADGAGGINAGSVTIQPPAPVSRIDSWAAIVD